MTPGAMLRQKNCRATATLFVAMLLAAPSVAGEYSTQTFLVDDGDMPRRVVAHIYKPAALPTKAPILVIMHGLNRDARGYLRTWEPLAEKYGAVLVAPEFAKAGWPKSRHYAQGNLLGANRRSKPPGAWSFIAMERAVKIAAHATGAKDDSFLLYGHSAGGQFVHRYIMVTGGRGVIKAVAANSGWYMWPDELRRYPFGVGGYRRNLKQAFARRLTILAGERDNNPDAKNLARSANAMAQGKTRLERARNFFAAARIAAGRNGATFNWRFATVPDAGHSNRKMSGAAARFLFGR
jgi:poly(3-hydroxybutyrate) depolymerase